MADAAAGSETDWKASYFAALHERDGLDRALTFLRGEVNKYVNGQISREALFQAQQTAERIRMGRRLSTKNSG